MASWYLHRVRLACLKLSGLMAYYYLCTYLTRKIADKRFVAISLPVPWRFRVWTVLQISIPRLPSHITNRHFAKSPQEAAANFLFGMTCYQIRDNATHISTHESMPNALYSSPEWQRTVNLLVFSDIWCVGRLYGYAQSRCKKTLLFIMFSKSYFNRYPDNIDKDSPSDSA